MNAKSECDVADFGFHCRLHGVSEWNCGGEQHRQAILVTTRFTGLFTGAVSTLQTIQCPVMQEYESRIHVRI
jgi:hypothetical protein